MSSYMKAAARCDITATKSSPVRIDERELLDEQIRARDWESVGEQIARDRAVLASAAETEQRKQELAARQRAAHLQEVRAANIEKREQAQAARSLQARDASIEKDRACRSEQLQKEHEETLQRANALQQERLNREAKYNEERKNAGGETAGDVYEAEDAGEPDGPLYKDNERYRTVGGHRAKAYQQQMQRNLEERRKKQEEEYKEMAKLQQDDDDEEENTKTAKATERAKEAEKKLTAAKLKQQQEDEENAVREEEQERRRARVHPIDILQRQIAADLICEREVEVAEHDDGGSADWIGKLDQYMEIERDAWREQAALERGAARGNAQVDHE